MSFQAGHFLLLVGQFRFQLGLLSGQIPLFVRQLFEISLQGVENLHEHLAAKVPCLIGGSLSHRIPRESRRCEKKQAGARNQYRVESAHWESLR